MDQIEFNERCDSSKQSSFHSTYISLCKEKNVPAILELIKSKNKLDFVADRLRTDQWEMICKSLDQDSTLEFLAIRSRKSTPPGICVSGLVNLFSFFVDNISSMGLEANEQIDSEKRPNAIAPLIRATSGCVKRNFVITKLALEGLPLTLNGIRTISTVTQTHKKSKPNSFYFIHVVFNVLGCIT